MALRSDTQDVLLVVVSLVNCGQSYIDLGDESVEGMLIVGEHRLDAGHLSNEGRVHDQSRVYNSVQCHKHPSPWLILLSRLYSLIDMNRIRIATGSAIAIPATSTQTPTGALSHESAEK